MTHPCRAASSVLPVGVLALLVMWSAPPPALAQDVLSPYWGDASLNLTVRDIRLLREHAGLTKEQLAAAVELFSGYRTEWENAQRRCMRLLNRAGEDLGYGLIDQPAQQEISRRESARRRAAQEQAERTFIGDLEILLTPEQHQAWRDFLRARRAVALDSVGVIPGPTLEPILGRFGLTAEDRRAAAETLEAAREDIDRIVRVLLPLYKEQNEILQAPNRDEAKVKDVGERLSAEYNRIVDRTRQAIRQIAGQLPGDRGDRLRAFYEAAAGEQLARLRPVKSQRPISEYLRISTLSADQKARLKALVEAAEAERLRIYRPVIDIRGRSSTPEDSQKAQRDENLAIAQADKAWQPAQARLTKDMRSVLTDPQRSAYDDGAEPPLAPNDMWFDDPDESMREDLSDLPDS